MGNGRSLLREHLAGPYERDFTAAAYGSRLGEEVAVDDSEDESDSSSPEDDDEEQDKPSKSIDLPTIAKNYNLPDLVGEFHILLNKTPNLINLSLNGYFHIFFGMPSPVFSTLQSLSLGPLLPFWPAVFDLGREEGPPMFGKLENLRVCGELRQLREAESIAGAKDEGGVCAFPRLKRVQWEAVEEADFFFSTGRPLRPTRLIYERVRVLQGLSKDLDSSNAITASTTPSRLIDIRLHPSDVTELFNDISTPQMHAAWQHGSPILAGPDSTPPRVLVTEGKAAKLEGERGKAIKALYRASREWWEDCAMLAKGDKVGAARCAAQKEENWMPGAGGGSRVTVLRNAKHGREDGEDDEEGEQAWTVTGWNLE